MDGIEDLIEAMSKCTTLTLSSESPHLKTSAILFITSIICSKGMRVQYLDLDNQFSAMVANLRVKDDEKWLSNLEMIIPVDREIEGQLVHFLSREDLGNGGAIVIDSINTLQDLLLSHETPLDFAGANHKATVLVTLFQELAIRNSKFLILSNIFRSRPRMNAGKILWDKEPAGGRMIRLKSDVLLSISEPTVDAGQCKITADVLSVSGGCVNSLRKGQKIELEANSLV